MNSSFLLTLAAQRDALRNTSCNALRALPTASNLASQQQPSGTQPSDSCVVSIEGLIASLRGIRTCNSSNAHPSSVQSSCRGLLPAPLPAARSSTAAAPQDVEAPRTGLSSSDASVRSGSANECRICLGSDHTGDLIQPCCCSGTLSTAHMTCLKLWVQERGSLVCELCGQRYKEPYVQQLEPLAAAAMQKNKHMLRSSSGRTLDVQPHRMTTSEWCALMLSLFLLTMSFVVISITMARYQTATPDTSAAGTASHSPPPSMGRAPVIDPYL